MSYHRGLRSGMGAVAPAPPPCTAVPCIAVPCSQTVSGWTLVAIAAAGFALNIIKFARPGKWKV